MFKCQVTGRTTRAGDKLNRIVIAKRDKVYTQKIFENGEWVNLEVGRGWEIVKEINASDEGVAIYNRMVEDGTVEEFNRRFK